MREALARSDHDFVLAGERRGREPPQGVINALALVLGAIWRVAAYPNRLLGGLVFALAIAITVNALLLQHNRHPAPLFHKNITLTEPDASTTQAAPTQAVESAPLAPLSRSATAEPDAPQPTARPQQDQIDQLLKSEAPRPAAKDEAERSKAAPHHHAHEVAREAAHEATEARPAGNDAIGQLLTSHEPRSEERPKTVLTVQKALMKLGFVVKPDGQMGAVTRQALEQYERDHHLPVEARLTPKLLHRLAAESGLAIE